MTIRPILRLAAVLTALSPLPVAARTVYEIPRDLLYLGFHGDPAEYVRMVAAGERDPRKTFRMGCPSDGGWAGAVYDGLLAKAKADPLVRDKLLAAVGSSARECPADAARFERFRIDSFRRDYDEGRLHLSVWAWGGSANPEVHALVREIARDGDVSPYARYVAAKSMIAHRMQDGTPELEALRAVVLDLASAPAIGSGGGGFGYESTLREDVWEGRAVGRLVAEYGDAFRCEYERIVGEHRPPPKLVERPPGRKPLGWALTREEAERLGVTLPPGVVFAEPPTQPKPCPGAGGR